MLVLGKTELISALWKTLDSTEIELLKKSVGSVFIESDFTLDDEVFLICCKEGISLTFQNSLLSSIHLHFDGKDNYENYSGWISDSFNTQYQSINQVIGQMGPPTMSGGGEEGFMGVVDSDWLRYDFSDYIIHYTFAEDKCKIDLVTLMAPESAP